jgi:hypothetical protein
VNKKRMQDNNVLDQAGTGKPVEVGAIWSEPAPQNRKHSSAGSLPVNDSVLHAGHFSVNPAASQNIASGQLPLPALLFGSPLRFKQGPP